MIPDADGKPEPPKSDVEQLSRLLDVELAQKRAVWKSAHTRYRTIRALSLLFLFVVAVGALMAFFLFFSELSEKRANQSVKPSPTSSP